jgi:hypothetical protein
MSQLFIGMALGLVVGIATGMLLHGHADSDPSPGQPHTGEPAAARDQLPGRDRGAPGDEQRQRITSTSERDTLAAVTARADGLQRELEEIRRISQRADARRAALADPLRWLTKLLPETFDGLTIAQLQHMRELDLSGSKLDVRDLAQLSALTELKRLTLRRTATDDAGLTYLMRLPSLTRLGLRETKVTDAGMPTIGAMKKLEHLDLNLLPITDDGLASIRALTSLKFLRLNFTLITDAGMAHVAQLASLRRLDLWATKVTDVGLDKIWHLKKLEHLELGAVDVTEGWVRRFRSEHPNCFVRSRWKN